jgi:hypothetical protein
LGGQRRTIISEAEKIKWKSIMRTSDAVEQLPQVEVDGLTKVSSRDSWLRGFKNSSRSNLARLSGL